MTMNTDRPHTDAIRQSLAEQLNEALAALREYVAAADWTMRAQSNDFLAAMIRFDEADKQARAVLAKHPTVEK